MRITSLVFLALLAANGSASATTPEERVSPNVAALVNDIASGREAEAVAKVAGVESMRFGKLRQSDPAIIVKTLARCSPRLLRST